MLPKSMITTNFHLSLPLRAKDATCDTIEFRTAQNMSSDSNRTSRSFTSFFRSKSAPALQNQKVDVNAQRSDSESSVQQQLTEEEKSPRSANSFSPRKTEDHHQHLVWSKKDGAIEYGTLAEIVDMMTSDHYFDNQMLHAFFHDI